MKHQAFNPYLPGWEYIPDGEPKNFGGRVYLYGSHDAARGKRFCPNDYVCWSAPETDLSDWRYRNSSGWVDCHGGSHQLWAEWRPTPRRWKLSSLHRLQSVYPQAF